MIVKQGKKTLLFDMDLWVWQMSDEVYNKLKLKNKLIDKAEWTSGDEFEFKELTIQMTNVKVVVQ